MLCLVCLEHQDNTIWKRIQSFQSCTYQTHDYMSFMTLLACQIVHLISRSCSPSLLATSDPSLFVAKYLRRHIQILCCMFLHVLLAKFRASIHLPALIKDTIVLWEHAGERGTRFFPFNDSSLLTTAGITLLKSLQYLSSHR